MLAAIVSGVIWYTIFRSVSATEVEEQEEGYRDDLIPESRFWSSGERTWENWSRYMLANSICEDLVDSPGWIGTMDESQQQELSIRLADAAVGVLKASQFHARRLRVSRGILRQQMVKMGQQPCEDALLNLAITAVNGELVHLEEELREVVRGHLWDELAEAD